MRQVILHICDRDNNRVRRVDARGIITTFAGDGHAASKGDGAAARDGSGTVGLEL